MPQPTIIQGPALVTHNGYSFYSEGAVTVRYQRETFNPGAAAYGKLGERLKSTRAVISFTPAGMYTSATAAKYWPYGATSVGASVFTGSALPTVILPLSGNKITYPRGGITKLPELRLSPVKTMWGAMEITCLGDPALEPTNAGYFQVVAATTADTNFDETKIVTPRYTAAYGSSPFDAMEPDEEGFVVEPILGLKEMMPANFGLTDIIIESLGLRARFKPINLTEAQIATLINLQDAAAKRPGDVIASTTTDLVISGTGVTFTAKYMGAADAGLVYSPGEFRQGEVAFHNVRKWSAGVPQALWTFA